MTNNIIMTEHLSHTLPHDNLHISSTKPLIQCQRKQCHTCQNKVRYYCPTCMIPMGYYSPPILPRLPFVFDIFKHRYENDGKSTSIHAKILCPDDCHMWIYPNTVHVYPNNPSTTLLLYPSPNSIPIHEIDPMSFTNIIVIDGTWSQAHQIVRDTPLLSHPELRHIKLLKPPKTKFWRYQHKSDTHLATIEAMWWLLREYCSIHRPNDNPNRYDNLLWYYTFQYQRILSDYQSKPDRLLTHQLHNSQFCADIDKIRHHDMNQDKSNLSTKTDLT